MYLDYTTLRLTSAYSGAREASLAGSYQVRSRAR